MPNLTPEEMLKRTTEYAQNLSAAFRTHVAVGLPQEKVGGKIYGDGMTIIRLGAIHEYGSTFTHPGGTGYVAGGGKARFVSKNFVGPVSGVTSSHRITIPRRSFLRVPFTTKKAELQAALLKQFRDVAEKNKPAAKAIGLVGVTATNISKEAFVTRGYGEWPDISQATKDAKGSDQVLVDTGTLRNSIFYAVRGQ